MQCQQLTQLFSKTGWILQVLDTKCASSNFVFVSRTNATTCCSYFFSPLVLACSLSSHVDGYVKGQNEWAGFAYSKARSNLNPSFFQAFYFFKQLGNRQHDTIADVAFDARPHDATRNQVQGRLDAIDDQSVTCIVPALETNNTLGAFCKPINQLSLAFITPLGAYNDYVPTFGCFHFKPDSI